MTSYDQIPEKLLITKEVRSVLWKILLHNESIDNLIVGKVWMVASGAANSMHMNQDYYFNLRDSVDVYPNPCFN